MTKYFITIMSLLIIVIFSLHNPPSLYSKIKSIKFDNKSIYLVQRGTTGKLGNIAKDFNIQNKYASHLGIGFLQNNSFIIYHLYVTKNEKQKYLYIETIDEFIKPKDLNYLSVWKLKDIDNNKFSQIKNTLINSEKENIDFDFDFHENNKKFYCSEYIVSELKKNNIEIMANHQKKIMGMVRRMLKRDKINYFPVDGFENTDKAVKIFEWIK